MMLHQCYVDRILAQIELLAPVVAVVVVVARELQVASVVAVAVVPALL